MIRAARNLRLHGASSEITGSTIARTAVGAVRLTDVTLWKSGAASALGVLLMLAACGDDGNAFRGKPPHSKPSRKGSPTHRAGPPPEPVRIHKGKATVSVTGGFNRRLALPPGPGSVYAAPPGQVALTWLDRDGDALIVRGTLGAKVKTSPDLSLSLVLQAGRPFVFVAGDNDCLVTMKKVLAKSFTGVFRCGKLRAKGKTIRAHGSFAGHR